MLSASHCTVAPDPIPAASVIWLCAVAMRDVSSSVGGHAYEIDGGLEEFWDGEESIVSTLFCISDVFPYLPYVQRTYSHVLLVTLLPLLQYGGR